VSLVISDTTPLNYLILIGQIEVLPKLFGRLIVPPAVIRERLHPKAPPTVTHGPGRFLRGWR
jgi:predicted nucleic acid-binding protein